MTVNFKLFRPLIRLSQYLLFILILFKANGTSAQNKDNKFYYNESFSRLVHEIELLTKLDSLDGYLVTTSNELFAIHWDLVLAHPKKQSIVYVKYHAKVVHPAIAFSQLIANMMNNESNQSGAFYHLDPYFILSELSADWAADCRFAPKNYPQDIAYARSFYHEESRDQISIVLIGKEIPYLNTPREINAFAYHPDKKTP